LVVCWLDILEEETLLDALYNFRPYLFSHMLEHFVGELDLLVIFEKLAENSGCYLLIRLLGNYTIDLVKTLATHDSVFEVFDD
jgi:hypothetical protein